MLITQRLVLTPVADTDQAELAAHWTDPDVRRFLFDGTALSPAQITQTVADSAASFTAHGYGLWLARGRGGHDEPGGHRGESLVGTAGLRPLDDLGVEVLYSLTPAVWGHGFATEAARAVIDHALGTVGLPEVLAEVDEGNTASIRVINRLGLTPFATVQGELGPLIRYRLRP
ncbi:GNAT family N-acetyltransferase [Frankia sp. Cpl3]|uniref:GNAT family N-acetyltransferase n=1 Tax=Parafrankia colletiae TaxID=573497 RepID=UPI0018E2F62F|nr:GNAT family N-acetyltransferase [Parafrankia colletiae]MCK9902201.1 GNAT family N-acetyltransferase [Frankia sp. Cpl3]